jgi:allatostatin receptor
MTSIVVTVNTSASTEMDNVTDVIAHEEEDPDLVRFRFAVHAVLVPILFSAITVIGLAGNSLVVYAVSTRRRLRTVTNLLLLNLAIADLCFVAVVPPFTAYEYVAGEMPQSSWALGDLACRLLHYLVNVTAYVTVYTLAMIAAVRYATIVHGVRTARWRTRRNVVRALVGLWALVMTVNIPILLSYSVQVIFVSER